MTEQKTVSDSESNLVEVQGEVYSRHLAGLMAEDIRLLASIAPNAWAIGDNSALTVGRTVALSFATPIRHGVLVDLNGLAPAGRDFALQNASSPQTDTGTLISVHSDLWTSSRVDLIRAGHISAVRQLAINYSGRCRIWRWLNNGRLQALEAIVGHPVPKPAYFDELLTIRANEADSPVLSAADQPGRPEPFFHYVANGILAAHKVNPNSWSIYNVKAGLTLSISGYSALFIANERADLLLTGTPDNPEYKSLGSIRKNTNFNIPVFRLLFDRRTQLAEHIQQFEESFLAAVRALAATTKTTTPRQAEFQPRLLRYIEEQTGLSLPSPAYFDDPTLDSASGDQMPVDMEVEEGLQTMGITNFIRQALAAQGLRYDRNQVATFYTALQTKGFVVLSGISGTGKSKIATGFVDLLPHGLTRQGIESISHADQIQLTVKPYVRKYRRVFLPKRSVNFLPPLGVGEQREVQVTLGDVHGSGRLEHRAHSGNSTVMVLYFRGAIGNAITDLPENSILFVEPVLDDDGDRVALFRLATSLEGVDSPEATDAVSNHLFLSVRPDWRDSTSLLGYYNPLTTSYEWTDFLRFILQASADFEKNRRDAIAWFVILDEMNLAHVEYYFADLLSVIESGRIEGGERDGFTREPLRLTYPDRLKETDEVPPQEVYLPPNLYLIGTVNMDETTHAFSPKVLDRAFTIELTDVNFKDYPPTVNSDASRAGLDEKAKQALLTSFSRDGKFARIDKSEIAAFITQHPEVRDWLQTLNERLANYRMHFGYRVFDEIVQYLANNAANGMQTWEEAFDQAVTMKVLPKFTGSRARLEDPLTTVWNWALTGGAEDPQVDGPAFPRVAERTQRMLAALERDGFVSFG